MKYFPKRLRPAGTVRESCSDGSKNSDEDSESSEESRSDFEDNGLENISDEKNRDSDDVYREIDRFGWKYLIFLFILIYFDFSFVPNLVTKLMEKMLRKKEIEFLQVQ